MNDLSSSNNHDISILRSLHLNIPASSINWSMLNPGTDINSLSSAVARVWLKNYTTFMLLYCAAYLYRHFSQTTKGNAKVSLMKHFPDYLQKQSDMNEKIMIFRYYVFFSVFLFQSFFRCVCNMGKRKKAQRKVQKRVVPKLAKVFNCPMCGAAESCTCYMYFYMTDGWVWLTIVTERRARQPYRAASVRSPLYLTKSQVFFFFTLIGRKKAWT